MNKPLILALLPLAGCATLTDPATRLQGAILAEQSAQCPTDNAGKAQVYGARALFDRTARDGLTDEQKSELEAARSAMDARCGLG